MSQLPNRIVSKDGKRTHCSNHLVQMKLPKENLSEYMTWTLCEPLDGDGIHCSYLIQVDDMFLIIKTTNLNFQKVLLCLPTLQLKLI